MNQITKPQIEEYIKAIGNSQTFKNYILPQQSQETEKYKNWVNPPNAIPGTIDTEEFKRVVEDVNIRQEYQNKICKLEQIIVDLKIKLEYNNRILIDLENKIIKLKDEIKKIKDANNITFINI